ncbi:hypothetical protein KOW79_016852 [Hemibagrus wyckioides]|uniref:Uncharacterized protein n=1 Tax=Hemibagrus wyckioides TaxID=337641 RepID=A0A9D3NDX3_9TELE|nr:hypothetical protein KOW79_016852 [Hemibagrus wyckioides]
MIAGSPPSYSTHTQTHIAYTLRSFSSCFPPGRTDRFRARPKKHPALLNYSVSRIFAGFDLLLELGLRLFLSSAIQFELLYHHVRGTAVQRGEDERLRSGQRRQPDVLQLRAARHKLVFRGVAGEKTPKTRPDRQSKESGHRGRPNRRGVEGNDGQSVTGRLKLKRRLADI